MNRSLLFLLPVIGLTFFSSAFLLAQEEKTWEAPEPQKQVDMDTTVVPIGKGGIFVPAMTDSEREPNFIVKKGDKIIASQKHGKTAVVEPGEYSVWIGSGVQKQMMEKKAKVVEGHVTKIKADWAGLLVNVVDQYNTPFRGAYELLAMESKILYGLGLGADVQVGEKVLAWILQPGVYKIIRPGVGFNTLTNFTTVRILPGRLTQFTLVLHRDYGDILGAGESLISPKAKRKTNWRVNISLSGNLTFSQRDNVIGETTGRDFSFSTMLQGNANYEKKRYQFFNFLFIEEDFTVSSTQDFKSTFDKVRYQSTFIYKIYKWLGVYVMGTLDTNFFPSFDYFDRLTDVVVKNKNGRIVSQYNNIDKLQLSFSMAPINIQEGVGFNFWILNKYYLQLITRFGLGASQFLSGGRLLIDNDSPDTNEKEYKLVGNYFLFGTQVSVLAFAKISKWIRLQLEFDMLNPFDDFTRPVFKLTAIVGLYLTSFSALDYYLTLAQDPNQSLRIQHESRLLLRFFFNYTI